MSLSLQQSIKDMYFEVVLSIQHACLTRVNDIRQLPSESYRTSNNKLAIKIKVCAAESFHPGQMILPSPLKTIGRYS